VIDLAGSWLDESSPIGADLSSVVENTVKVLEASRKAGIPVFFTTMAFDPGLEEAAGPVGKKLTHVTVGRSQIRGSEWVELHPALQRRPNEILLEKQRASAFWGTPLLAHLVARKVDTLIITGCSTSGCVRATAESAHNYNFHTIVVEEAVGERSPLAHMCNLIDIDLRYADVVKLDEVLAYLKQLERP